MIAVIDYNCGNLASLSQALISLGAPHRVVSSAEQFTDVNAIILPGVGHFGHAVRNLDGLKLREPILDAVQQGIPLLGICLGMQLLLRHERRSRSQPLWLRGHPGQSRVTP
jgi:imidazole glycerol-phosphate synthase subunit HisH